MYITVKKLKRMLEDLPNSAIIKDESEEWALSGIENDGEGNCVFVFEEYMGEEK